MIDYEKEAIETLQKLYRGEPFAVMDSGGKDSSVLTHVCEKAKVGFYVVHNLTTVDAPETVQFIKEKFRKFEEKGIHTEIKRQPYTMADLIIKNGMPPTRRIRYCCAKFKETWGVGEKAVTGVRKAESKARADSQGLVTIFNTTKEIEEANKTGISKKTPEEAAL